MSGLFHWQLIPQTKAWLSDYSLVSHSHFYTCFSDWYSLWLKRELFTHHIHCSPLYLMEASLSQVLYYWYANTIQMFFLRALKLNRDKMSHLRASLLLFIYIKTFLLLKLVNLDLNGVGGQHAYSLTHLVMEYMTEVAMMHLPPINHCQSFLQ